MAFLKCRIIKSFDGLAVGKEMNFSKEWAKKRAANKEVVILEEVNYNIDDSLIEDQALHADNANEFELIEEEIKPKEKAKSKVSKVKDFINGKKK